VSFAAITLCVASRRVFIVVYFVIDSVRKLLDTPSYTSSSNTYTEAGNQYEHRFLYNCVAQLGSDTKVTGLQTSE
jgi:hypothetical protein